MSVKKCCVPKCSKSREEDVILHVFPNPDKELDRFTIWRNAVGGEVLSLDPVTVFQLRRICHSHFDIKYYTWSKRLGHKAVPTLNLSGDTIEQDACVPEETSFHNDTSEPECSVDVFSWEKTGEAIEGVPEEEVALQKTSGPIEGVPEDASSCQKTSEPVACPEDRTSQVHEGYRCNICEGDTIGYRYTCVQCTNFDLCASCEGRGAHASHYVLRVPAHRPYAEIEAVLSRIRSALLGETHSLLLAAVTDDVSVKSELGEDPLCSELTDEMRSTAHSPSHSDVHLHEDTGSALQEDDNSIISDKEVTSREMLREVTLCVEDCVTSRRKTATIQSDQSATDIRTDEPPEKARRVSETPSELVQRHDVELDGYVRAQVTTEHTDGRSSSNVATGSNIDFRLTSGPGVVIKRLVKISPKNQSQSGTESPLTVNTRSRTSGTGVGRPYHYTEEANGRKIIITAVKRKGTGSDAASDTGSSVPHKVKKILK